MSKKNTWIALVALAEPLLPAPEDVAAEVARRWPDAEPLKLTSQTEAMATFEWGDATIAYTLVPRPIPWSQLEGPCSIAWYWPEAEQAFRSQSAHLFVTLFDEGRKAVDKAIRLTQFTAALASLAPAMGIVWGAAGNVHEPEAFDELAREMNPDHLPLHLWIDFRMEPIEEDGWRLFTTGLEPLDHPEIEVVRYDGDPQELLDHVYNIAHYLLDKGVSLQNGETIGLTDSLQASVRHDTSMLGGDQQVIQLEFV